MKQIVIVKIDAKLNKYCNTVTPVTITPKRILWPLKIWVYTDRTDIPQAWFVHPTDVEFNTESISVLKSYKCRYEFDHTHTNDIEELSKGIIRRLEHFYLHNISFENGLQFFNLCDEDIDYIKNHIKEVEQAFTPPYNIGNIGRYSKTKLSIFRNFNIPIEKQVNTQIVGTNDMSISYDKLIPIRNSKFKYLTRVPL